MKHYKRFKTYGDPVGGPKFNDPSYGQGKDPLYLVWRAMIDRCENPKVKGYHRYGGRGISVCTRWRQSFLAWKSDLGPRPVGFMLERLDNNGDYCPENCRWASKKEQANNTSTNHYIIYKNERRTLAEWAELTNIPAGTIKSRLRSGWAVEEALTRKSSKTFKHAYKIPETFCLNGKTQSLKKWALEYNITIGTLSSRIYQLGWPLEEALITPKKINQFG